MNGWYPNADNLIRNFLFWRFYLPSLIFNLTQKHTTYFAIDCNITSLLWDDFEEWLFRFQDKIRKVVHYHACRFNIDDETKQDLVQDLNMFLLSKREHLLKQCSPNWNPAGFFSVVINRECMHLIKKLKKRELVTSQIPPQIFTLSSDQQEIINTQLMRLRAIMKTFHTKQTSIEFMIKLSLHIQITNQDIDRCFGVLNDSAKTQIIASRVDLQMMTEQKAFMFMNPYFDQREKKHVSYDSRIKRTNNHKAEILNLLNKGGNYYYDHETMDYLFEFYFYSKDTSKS